MNPVLTIVLLWLAFGTSHIVLSSLWLRGRLVAALGEKGFLGLYSLIPSPRLYLWSASTLPTSTKAFSCGRPGLGAGGAA